MMIAGWDNSHFCSDIVYNPLRAGMFGLLEKTLIFIPCDFCVCRWHLKMWGMQQLLRHIFL